MPGSSEMAGFLINLLNAVNRLPHVAGLPPNQWLGIALIAGVIGLFLVGNPSRSR
jgi:hypothetical protein